MLMPSGMSSDGHILTSVSSILQNRGRNRIRTCKRCKFSTTDPKDFLHHQLNAHNENSNQHCCEKCNFVTPSYLELLKHKRNHPDKNRHKKMSTDSDPGTPAPWDMPDDKSEKSDVSDGTIPNLEASDDDMVVRSGITLPTRTYTCPDCGTSTTSPRLHLRHLVEDHGYDYQIYECDLCDYATRYKQKLPRHRKCHFMSPVSSPRVLSPPIELPFIPLNKKPKFTGSKSETENLNNDTDNDNEREKRETDRKEEVEPKERANLRTEEDMLQEEDDGEDQALMIDEDPLTRDINENLKQDLHSKGIENQAEPKSQERNSSYVEDRFNTESFNNLRERLTSSSFMSFGGKDLLGSPSHPLSQSLPSRPSPDDDANLIIDTDKMAGSVSFTVDKPVELQQTMVPKPKAKTAPFREAVDPAKYIRIQDVDGIKYACSKCGNIYKWRKSLNKHWKEKHDGEIPTPIGSPGFTMLNVPQVRSAQNSLSGLSLPKPALDKGFNKSPLDRNVRTGFTSTIGQTSFGNTSPIKFSAKTLKMSPFSDAYSKSVWSGRSETMSRASPVMHSTPSPSMMSRSRPETPVSNPALYNRVSKPKVYDKPTPSSGMTYGLPPAAHSRGSNKYKELDEQCEEGPLDLSKTSKIPQSNHAALDLTGKCSAAASDNKKEQKSLEQPLDFSSNVKSDGKVLPGLPGVVVKEEVDDYQEFQVRGTGGLQIFSSQETWQCYKCTYVASSGKDYERHLQEHANKHTCYECKQSFVAVDDLNAHFSSAHMDVIEKKLYSEDSHPEEGGGKEQGSMQLYKYLTMPKEMNTLNCIICGSKFTWGWDLQKHFDQLHTSLPNPYRKVDQAKTTTNKDVAPQDYNCNQCKFVARDSAELARHQLIHSFNRPFACTKCGYSTKWSEDLDQHMTRYHGSSTGSPSPQKSEQAEDSNDSVANVYEKNTYFSQLGLRSSNADSPSPPASAKKHSTLFGSISLSSSMESLNTTSQSADGSINTSRSRGRKPGTNSSAEILLPYKCSVCEYRARWPSEITQHMKNHSDEKPFHCPRCTYKSKWKWDVVKHLKRCGGGTVKDVIDTTKQRKSSSPPWVKALQFNKSATGSQPSSGTSTLSGGPPNVTVVPVSQAAAHESPSQVLVTSPLVDDSKLVPYSRNSSGGSRSGSPQLSQQPAVFRGILNQGQYHCLQCPFVGNSPAELKRHTRVHSDEKPFGCLTCGYCSKWKCDLKKHLRTYNHQPAPQPGEAGYNDYSDEDATMDDSQDSDSSSHRPALYRCDRCQYSTFKKESLEAHTCMQAFGHSGANRLTCKQCDFESRDLPSFLQHKLSHNAHQRAGSPCSQEGSSDRDVSQPMSPPRHRRKPQKSNIQHRCPKCPFTCFSKMEMLAHQARHGTEAAGRLVCEYCDFHAEEREEIDQHSKLHPEHYQEFNMGDEEDTSLDAEGTEPREGETDKKGEGSPAEVSSAAKTAKSPGTSGYQCDKCPYFTFHRSNYEKHYRMHGANHKYKCEWCDWSIDRLNLLFRHAKYAHPIEFQQKEKEGNADSPVPAMSGGSELEDGDKENTDIEEDGREMEKEKLKRQMDVDKKEEPHSKKIKLGENESEQQHFLELRQTNFDGGGTDNVTVEEVIEMEEEEKGEEEDEDEEEDEAQEEEENSTKNETESKNLHKPGLLDFAVDLTHPAVNLSISTLRSSPKYGGSSPNERGSGRKLHKCPNCPYRVKCRDALQHHINLHGAGHPFKCHFCDYSVHRSNLLIQHMRVHTSDAVTPSSLPGRSEASLAAGNKVKPLLKLKLANLIKVPNTILKSKSLSQAKTTSAIAQSKLSIRTRYKCSRCPYVSFCKSNLVKHKKLHLMTSKYRCNYCTYSACRWTLLKQHVKFHEGVAEGLAGSTGKLEKFNDVYLDGEDDAVGNTKGHTEKKRDVATDQMEKDETGENGEAAQDEVGKEEIQKEDDMTVEAKKNGGVSEETEKDASMVADVDNRETNENSCKTNSESEAMKGPLGSPLGSPARKKRLQVCGRCPFTCASQFDFQKHANLHNADLKFRCDYCDYSLSRLNLMYQHRKLHSGESGFNANPSSDEVLNKAWSGSDVVKEDKEVKNVLNNNDDDKKEGDEDGYTSLDEAVAFSELKEDDSQGKTDVMRFGCKHCPYKCNSPQNYRVHVEMHGAQKKYLCDFCDWSADRLNLMFQHRKVHAADASYDPDCKCEKLLNQVVEKAAQCRRIMDVLPKLKPEEKQFNKPKLYNCDTCPFKCDKRQSYLTHVKLHDGSKQYTCGECNYSVDRVNLLYQHTRLHEEDADNRTSKLEARRSPVKKRLRCTKCPYHTHSHILLDLHTKMHAAGKKYMCQFCDYSIDRFNLLQQHMKIHIETKPSSAVTTSSVESESQTPKKVHGERAGSTEKKAFYYKCDRCPYQTNNRGNFENHKNQHFTKSKLGCPYCNYSSPRSAQLASHIRIHFPGSKLDIETIRALIAGANQEHEIDPATPIPSETDGERSRESTPGVLDPPPVEKIGKKHLALVCKYCDREFGDIAACDQHERQHLIGINAVC